MTTHTNNATINKGTLKDPSGSLCTVRIQASEMAGQGIRLLQKAAFRLASIRPDGGPFDTLEASELKRAGGAYAKIWEAISEIGWLCERDDCEAVNALKAAEDD